MKTLYKSLFLASAILMSSLGHAQFGGLGGLKDAMGGGSSSSGGDSLALQSELILGMSLATNSFAKAYSLIEEAIDNGDESKKLGNLVGEESETDKKLGVKMEAIESSAANFEKWKAEGGTLDEKGKKTFAKALLPYSLGMVAMGKMAKTAPEFLKAAADEIKSIKNPMQIIKIKKQFELGMKTGKAVPGLFKVLGDSSKSVFSFAKANDISDKNASKNMKNVDIP